MTSVVTGAMPGETPGKTWPRQRVIGMPIAQDQPAMFIVIVIIAITVVIIVRSNIRNHN